MGRSAGTVVIGETHERFSDEGEEGNKASLEFGTTTISAGTTTAAGGAAGMMTTATGNAAGGSESLTWGLSSLRPSRGEPPS